MFDDGFLTNPINDFIWSLPRDRLDEELDWMVKNLSANFQKLYGCTVNIVQVQNDYLLQKRKGGLDLLTFCTCSIEFFHMKVDTIFDLTYQIYVKLCSPRNVPKRSKHEHLKERFARFNSETGSDLQLEWFEVVNTVRNRIVHGGFSIKTFIRDYYLAFQAYDRDLEEQLNDDHGFFFVDSPLIYADLYTNFYTSTAHEYIRKFLAFVIHCLRPESAAREPLDIVERQCKQSGSILYYGFEDVYLATASQLGKR